MSTDTAARPFQRALVIGCPGAGKSTFARALGDRTGLPVVHLDQLFWEPGWEMAPQSVYRARLDAALAGDRWIVDGANPSTLELRLSRADAIFWLDLPRWQCLARIGRRVLTSYGRVRPDMAAGCPERLDVEFVSYVLRFHGKYNAGMAEVIVRSGKKDVTYRCHSDREAQAHLAMLRLD